MRHHVIDAPTPRPSGAVNPWIEIAAWLLAFTILLFAPCAPERDAHETATARTTDQSVLAKHR